MELSFGVNGLEMKKIYGNVESHREEISNAAGNLKDGSIFESRPRSFGEKYQKEYESYEKVSTDLIDGVFAYHDELINELTRLLFAVIEKYQEVDRSNPFEPDQTHELYKKLF